MVDRWLLLALTAVGSGLGCGPERSVPERPNIILIMADDLGYETLRVNGGTSYQTPNFDQLAGSGMRFTHAYATPLCTPTPEETDHRYHYARWNGEGWIDNEITAAGGWFPQTPEDVVEPEPHYSGGIVLDHEDPSVVYLSRPVAGVFEIERWWTEDGGVTWRSRPITTGSANDNVRPFVIREHGRSSPTLLWMENRSYRHYLDFDSAIRIDRVPR